MRLGDPPLKVLLKRGWNPLIWTGDEGASVVKALEGAGLSGEILAVYRWDEGTGTWLGHFPGGTGQPGSDALANFSAGQAYWVAVGEPVAWVISSGGPS